MKLYKNILGYSLLLLGMILFVACCADDKKQIDTYQLTMDDSSMNQEVYEYKYDAAISNYEIHIGGIKDEQVDSDFVLESETASDEIILPLPLEGIIIGLDPGHQALGNYDEEPIGPGSDITKAKVSSGTIGIETGIWEYELNLDLALILEVKLIEQGATVILTRRTHDVDISNMERAIMMNEAEVDLHIRLHCNGSADSNAQGAMILVPGSEFLDEELETESHEIAEAILGTYIESTGAKNLGIITRDDITGFNWSEVPVILMEFGFMTNVEEDILLNDPDYRKLCCDGIVEGILNYYTNETFSRSYKTLT